MKDPKTIRDAIAEDVLVVGSWPRTGTPLGVVAIVDGRRWVVYRDEIFRFGWVVALIEPDAGPIEGSELWVPVLPGEAEVPRTWWRRFCDGSRALPEQWQGHLPPSMVSMSEPSGSTPRFGFVMVANRLPVEAVSEAVGPGSLQWRTSPGGLVTALEPVVQRQGGAWVGWPGRADGDDEPFDRHGMHLMPVTLSAAEISGFYDGFSNATLWPLYHDAIVEPCFDSGWWEAYRRINQRFADTAASRAALGATVWVHDYQLQLVPAMLRAARPDLRIGFFNHIPFPGREIFAQLPWRRPVLEGLLGADAVGFQRASDASNFVQACRRWVPTATVDLMPTADEAASTPRPPSSASGRSVRVGTFPISIDVADFEGLAGRADVQSRAREIRAELGDPGVLMLAVDRLDYTKGILHRLTAYEALLRDGVVGPTEVLMVQIATPSRERVTQYRALMAQVEAIVGRINGNYSTIGQPAVRYLHQSFPREELAALYLAADVMLVSSLRDGMNLVAKEYVACRVDDKGVLVLSEFTGAADELAEGAILFNPHDRAAAKKAIQEAINMSKAEATHRMQALRHHIQNHDVYHWAASFLAFLKQSPTPSAPRSTSTATIAHQRCDHDGASANQVTAADRGKMR